MSELRVVDTDIQPEVELAARLGRAWRAIRRGASVGRVRERIYGTDEDAIEPGQMDALDLLVQVDAHRMGDLASALDIDPSTATRAVQRLMKDGLVARVEKGGDGRVVYVGITDKGRSVHQQVAERRLDVLRRIVSKFPEKDALVIAESLEQFVQGIEAVAKEKHYHHK